MPDDRAAQKQRYPLPAYNFHVTIDSASASFVEASGLTAEYETLTYRHGFSRWEGEQVVRFLKLGHTTVTLKKGVAPGVDFLSQWLTKDPSTPRGVAISLCDETGAPIVVWRIKEAIPVKLSAPAFDVNGAQTAIETLELLASGISVEYL
jgi:phage tail-like protein